jgi:sugar O-acyltransferase (sialic acid O-acetyltransferase NeuD family)
MLRSSIAAAGYQVAAVVDRRPDLPSPFLGAVRLGAMGDVKDWIRDGGFEGIGFIVAIGGHNGDLRCNIADELQAEGLEPFSAIHPTAWVADTARVSPGCHVMPLAAVAEETVLGRQTIVNTSASVDHECVLGRGVHVMPGATLAGCIQVGDHATIGSNATIFPRVSIGAGAQIGAGSVVTKDVVDNAIVIGAPARQRNVT